MEALYIKISQKTHEKQKLQQKPSHLICSMPMFSSPNDMQCMSNEYKNTYKDCTGEFGPSKIPLIGPNIYLDL